MSTHAILSRVAEGELSVETADKLIQELFDETLDNLGRHVRFTVGLFRQRDVSAIGLGDYVGRLQRLLDFDVTAVCDDDGTWSLDDGTEIEIEYDDVASVGPEGIRLQLGGPKRLMRDGLFGPRFEDVYVWVKVATSPEAFD